MVVDDKGSKVDRNEEQGRNERELGGNDDTVR
jgi:hypothetical protein